jgi:general stress protein 26
MDSINQQQKEKNHEDLHGAGAVKKIKELVKNGQACFFCTSESNGSEHTRPMSVLKIDEEAHLWFLSANDSHKNQELSHNTHVKLYFQGSSHSDFLLLEGSAQVSKNKEKISELWSPELKTWFTEGKDDPRISVIHFIPSGGYYWDTKHGMAVAGVKMLLGATLGVTLDDSIEGQIRV